MVIDSNSNVERNQKSDFGDVLRKLDFASSEMAESLAKLESAGNTAAERFSRINAAIANNNLKERLVNA